MKQLPSVEAETVLATVEVARVERDRVRELDVGDTD